MKKKKIWISIAIIFGSVSVLFTVLAILLLNWLMPGGIKDHRKFILENEQEMTRYADAFLEQSSINSITRFHTLSGVFYSIHARDERSKDKEPAFTFTAPYDEERFWKTADLEKIRGETESSNTTLSLFLAANNIPPEEFFKWRDFLLSYKFERIQLEDSQYFIMIWDTPWSNFQHHKFPSSDYGYAPKYIDVITPHWAYYDEHGIPYPRE